MYLPEEIRQLGAAQAPNSNLPPLIEEPPTEPEVMALLYGLIDPLGRVQGLFDTVEISLPLTSDPGSRRCFVVMSEETTNQQSCGGKKRRCSPMAWFRSPPPWCLPCRWRPLPLSLRREAGEPSVQRLCGNRCAEGRLRRKPFATATVDSVELQFRKGFSAVSSCGDPSAVSGFDCAM